MAGPYDKFTVRANRVMDMALEEARGFNHDYIGTEHILLGLARETEGIAAKALAKLEVDEAQLREVLESIIGPGVGTVSDDPGLTIRAKRALDLALDEARELGHHYVGTEHLLIGLIREEHGVAAGILSSVGVTLNLARAQIEALLLESGRRGTMREAVENAIGRIRGRKAATAPNEVKGNVITCRITDQDLAAIDALVESGIRTTRSDAAAWLISAGVEARRDVLDKVFATIEGIRQLRAEARAIAEQAGMGAAPAQEVAKTGEGVREGTTP
jgi:ATP-dependent Clp protease ATP-binding subunit ClpA